MTSGGLVIPIQPSEALNSIYSHLSNNRGGWNKRVGVQKLQNQLDFSIKFYDRIKIYSSKGP